MFDVASLVSEHLRDHMGSVELVDFEVDSDSSITKFLVDAHDVEDLVASFVVMEGVCHGHDRREDFWREIGELSHRESIQVVLIVDLICLEGLQKV